eukprot:14334966-Alexandrium_andersonii.AAC.1
MAGPQRAAAPYLCLACAKAVCPRCFATTGQLTCKACSGGAPLLTQTWAPEGALQWVGLAEGLPPPVEDESAGRLPPPDERSVLAACGAASASGSAASGLAG